MKLVLLPIEILAREHDSKLLIAAELLKRGISVLIGHDKAFNKQTHNFYDCGLLDKSCSSLMGQFRINDIHKNGGYTVVCDEEGVNDIEAYEENYIKRMDRETLSKINKYIFWGQHDKQFMMKHFNKELRHKGVVAGNARGDVISRRLNEEMSRELKTQLGESSLLIVDNFGPLTKMEGIQFLPKYQDESKAAYNERIERFRIKQEQRIVERDWLIQLATKMSTLDNAKIIIRPHPRSSRSFWKEKLQANQNCYINDDYAGETWIQATGNIISCGCSLGLEGIAGYITSVDLSRSTTGKKSVCHRLSQKIDSIENIIDIVKKPNIGELQRGYKGLDYYWNQNNDVCKIIAQIFDANIANSSLSENIRFTKQDLLVTDERKWPSKGKERFEKRTRDVLTRLNGGKDLSIQKISSILLLISP